MKAPRAHLGALWVSDSRAGTLYRIDLDGKVTVVAALITEVKYQPPYWVHAALWIPLILIVTLWPLRGLKSLLISLQYHHKAS